MKKKKKKNVFQKILALHSLEFLYFAQLSFPIVINSFINCCTFFDPTILGRKRRNEPSLWPPCPGCALPGAWVPACQEYVADRSHPLLPLTSGRAAHLLLFLIRTGPSFFSVSLTVVSSFAFIVSHWAPLRFIHKLCRSGSHGVSARESPSPNKDLLGSLNIN